MNLKALEYCVEIARQGSFTKAAQALHVAQPALSMAVGRLEEELGVALFNRATRQISVTAEGQLFLARAEACLEGLAGARRELQDLTQLHSGEIRVGVPPMYGIRHIPELLMQFRARYPGITVNLRLGNAQETLAALLSEHADVAVLTEVEPRNGLHLQPLSESRICALVPASHPWAKQPEGIHLEHLHEVIMVLREPGSITRRTFDDACLATGVQPKVLLELDSREAVTEAVAAELGVGVVSSIEVSPDPRVQAIPLRGDGLVNRHMLGCMERRRALRLIQAFFELAP